MEETILVLLCVNILLGCLTTASVLLRGSAPGPVRLEPRVDINIHATANEGREVDKQELWFPVPQQEESN